MRRKTIEIEFIRELANRMLAAPAPMLLGSEATSPEQAYRRAVMSFVESALHHAECYKGFGYRDTEVDSETHALRDDYDPTRVMFY
jgi:hypothetical protein